MNNPVSKFFMAAVFIYLLTVSAVWADRVLIDDPQQTVTVGNHISCYQPVDITVDTVKPSLYEADSMSLQKLGDSVKAMLSYECPGLSSIALTGLIRGLDEIVYQGEMSKNNNWRVQALALSDQAYESNQRPLGISDQTRNQQSSIAKRYDDELIQGQLEVTGLHLGMSVDQVTDSIIKTFGLQPTYDAQQGVMTMNSGHCPQDLSLAHEGSELNSELKCLQAWFSDNRVARLQRLTLFQVVDGQVHQVNNLLFNKYGNPTQTSSNDDNTETQMIWRALSADTNQTVIQEVDAIILNVDTQRVATNVSLYTTEDTNNSEESFADLDLKL